MNEETNFKLISTVKGTNGKLNLETTMKGSISNKILGKVLADISYETMKDFCEDEEIVLLATLSSFSFRMKELIEADGY